MKKHLILSLFLATKLYACCVPHEEIFQLRTHDLIPVQEIVKADYRHIKLELEKYSSEQRQKLSMHATEELMRVANDPSCKALAHPTLYFDALLHLHRCKADFTQIKISTLYDFGCDLDMPNQSIYCIAHLLDDKAFSADQMALCLGSHVLSKLHLGSAQQLALSIIHALQGNTSKIANPCTKHFLLEKLLESRSSACYSSMLPYQMRQNLFQLVAELEHWFSNQSEVSISGGPKE